MKYKISHIQPDGKLDAEHTDQISFLPYVHNVDSFGYNTNLSEQGEAYKTKGWDWLLGPKYSGKVGIVNALTIGLFDLALATQVQGLIKFNDIDSLTKTDLEVLFKVHIDFSISNVRITSAVSGIRYLNQWTLHALVESWLRACFHLQFRR